jgi:hypothetical protein
VTSDGGSSCFGTFQTMRRSNPWFGARLSIAVSSARWRRVDSDEELEFAKTGEFPPDADQFKNPANLTHVSQQQARGLAADS